MLKMLDVINTSLLWLWQKYGTGVEASFLSGLLLLRVHRCPDPAVCAADLVRKFMHVAGSQLVLRANWDLYPIFNVGCRWESVPHGTLRSVRGDLGEGGARRGGRAPQISNNM